MLTIFTFDSVKAKAWNSVIGRVRQYQLCYTHSWLQHWEAIFFQINPVPGKSRWAFLSIHVKAVSLLLLGSDCKIVCSHQLSSSLFSYLPLNEILQKSTPAAWLTQSFILFLMEISELSQSLTYVLYHLSYLLMVKRNLQSKAEWRSWG